MGHWITLSSNRAEWGGYRHGLNGHSWKTWHGHRYGYQEIRETWRGHGLAHDS